MTNTERRGIPEAGRGEKKARGGREGAESFDRCPDCGVTHNQRGDG